MTVLNKIKNGILKNISKCNKVQVQSLWGYVEKAFNQVDYDRLNLVGPDRLCAEWIIKNGGAIRTVDAPSYIMRDYNTMPPENVRFKIKLVDGSGSSIMKIGLEHFRGCNFIDTVIFHQCKNLEEDGLQGLIHLRNSLIELQISECDGINDESLLVLEKLRKLKVLRLLNLSNVQNPEKVTVNLTKTLPNCKISTTLPKM